MADIPINKASDWLAELNPQQREAVTCEDRSLLIVAGAGTGKTKTLACRVAHLLSKRVPPERILLLTFTRRAAEEMLNRAASSAGADIALAKRIWGGTFHATGNRLLRIYAKAAGLSPDFTILDQADAEDFLNVVRADLGLSAKGSRFPRKATCLDIYSRRVNGNAGLEDILKRDFPWCLPWKDELNRLFGEYARRKQSHNLLDYDDLLLYWYYLVQDEAMAIAIGSRFEHILVDEYQDTNAIQAGILRAMRQPETHLTAVGDDAQSIYSFRSATVRNMLEFPAQFPPTRIFKLEQNYRSLPPILQTANAVIRQSKEAYAKELWCERKGGQMPQLVHCEDEDVQSEAVIKRILEHYEQGVPLRQQAVLFRSNSHSAALELALARHNIPFHKFGGLRFLENAHIKDLLAFLRIAENPRDRVAWMRVLQLISGVGPGTAQSAFLHVATHSYQPSSLKTFRPQAAPAGDLQALAAFLEDLGQHQEGATSQIERIMKFYFPLLRENYENAEPRVKDIEHLAEMARRAATRREFLTELTLDPPASTGDLAGAPSKDDDWLVLSTIHSAKGLEWKAVYLIHAADGSLPADMATGTEAEIEEELRLTYVALTRAHNFLYVFWPLRYYVRSNGLSDRHSYSQLCRFFNDAVLATMEVVTAGELKPPASTECAESGQSIFDKVNQMWR